MRTATIIISINVTPRRAAIGDRLLLGMCIPGPPWVV
jgi:hypothetical protein